MDITYNGGEEWKRENKMNRAQRRKQMRKTHKFQPTQNLMQKGELKNQVSQPAPDFSGVSITTLCQSISLLICELNSRGYPVYDFDHKDKVIQGIKIIKNKVYFLVVQEVTINEKEPK